MSTLCMNQCDPPFEKSWLRPCVSCFYRIIETWMDVWENEKCCGTTRHEPQIGLDRPYFWVFQSCFNNSTCNCLHALLKSSRKALAARETNLITARAYKKTRSACMLAKTIDTPNDWLTADWSINRLTDWLTEWLIDWWKSPFSTC